MATKKKHGSAGSGDAAAVAAKVDDKFTYIESGTLVVVCHVDKEAGTVDVQEPDGAKRYWGGVPSNTEWLAPAE